MKVIRYRTKVLPDGHLPVPKEFTAHEGDEVEVTVAPANGDREKKKARQRADYMLKRWAGAGKGSGAGVAQRHDEFLYGRDRS